MQTMRQKQLGHALVISIKSAHQPIKHLVTALHLCHKCFKFDSAIALFDDWCHNHGICSNSGNVPLGSTRAIFNWLGNGGQLSSEAILTAAPKFTANRPQIANRAWQGG